MSSRFLRNNRRRERKTTGPLYANAPLELPSDAGMRIRSPRELRVLILADSNRGHVRRRIENFGYVIVRRCRP